MSAQDYFFKKSLLTALKYKYKYPRATAFKIGNTYFRYDPAIYKWSRRLFPQNFNKLFPDNDEFVRQIVLADQKGDRLLKAMFPANPEDAADESEQIRAEIAQDNETEQKYYQNQPVHQVNPEQLTAQKKPYQVTPSTPTALKAPIPQTSISRVNTQTAPGLSMPRKRAYPFPKPSNFFPPAPVNNLFSKSQIYTAKFANRALSAAQSMNPLSASGGGLRFPSNGLTRVPGRGLAKSLAKKSAVRLGLTIGWEPVVIAVVIVILVTLFGPILQNLLNNTSIFGPSSVAESAAPPPNPTSLAITKTQTACQGLSCTGQLNQPVTYTITVTNTGSADNLQLVDNFLIVGTLKNNLQITDPGGGQADLDKDTLTWSIDNSQQKKDIISVQFTVKPTKDNIYIADQPSVTTTTVQPPVGTNPNPAPAPPNNSDPSCTGNYNLKFISGYTSPLGQPSNFGDPGCEALDVTKFDDKFGDLLKSLDSANDYTWRHIAQCETRYQQGVSPNSTNGANQGPNTINPYATNETAFGLFQMGSGKAQYDQGDVPWREQTSNAINRNKITGGTFAYWPVSEHSNPGGHACEDI